jgi:hypothetical protein
MANVSPIDLQKALKGANYPASRSDLVECAKSNGADSGLVQQLSGLGEDRFDGPNEVEKSFFG